MIAAGGFRSGYVALNQSRISPANVLCIGGTFLPSQSLPSLRDRSASSRYKSFGLFRPRFFQLVLSTQPKTRASTASAPLPAKVGVDLREAFAMGAVLGGWLGVDTAFERCVGPLILVSCSPS